MSTDPPYLGHLVAEFTHIPSNPMVIRRYRGLNERNLRSFFEEGLYCSNITEFEDNNEGLVEHGAENPSLRAGAVALANFMRRRRELPELDLSPEGFRQGLVEYHAQARRKYFANCWRIGTGERDVVWQEYTGDEDMVEGFAFETTVGQFIDALPEHPPGDDSDDNGSGDGVTQTPTDEMYVGQPTSDMRVGAVQYQIRDLPSAVQPIGNEASINYFKGSGFDHEIEFRFLINPFDNARELRFGMDGRPVLSLPGRIPDGVSFPLDTKELVNRIVLAPNAGDEQREMTEEVLDDIGVSYGSDADDDLEIVESTDRGPPLYQVRPYTAEFAGTDNYEGSPEHLNGIRERFVDETNPDHWPVLDLVELVNEKAGTVIENYRHANESPDIQMEGFGHNGYQAVIVNRIHATDGYEEYRNEMAREMFEDAPEGDGD